MSLATRFRQFIEEHQLFSHADPLLLAVSGGADSVALVHLCRAHGFSFAIAHANFQLRGEESRRDEAFVQQLSTQYQAPCFVQHFDTEAYAKNNQCSIQEAARILRYQWFEEIITGHGFNRLLTAHHANDNVETLLQHLFKGTGIRGLTGIPLRNGNIVRPLLFARRTEIEQYLQEHQLPFVEDSSNALDKYDRNFIRNRLLPLVREHFPQAEENMLQSIQRFTEAEQVYSESIAQKKSKLLEKNGQEWHIPVRKLLKQKPLPTLVYELLKPFAFTPAQTGEAVKLLHAPTGKQLVSPTHRLIKNRNWLVIAPVEQPAASLYIINAAGERTVTETGSFSTREMMVEPGTPFPKDQFTALLDARYIQYPLILRKWKTGDYFYPLGMRKKKKLARFFIDNKLSKTEKEKVLVLESNKKILWVIGCRIDDRVKITPATSKGLLCLFEPATI